MSTMKTPSPPLARWIVYLQEFQYAVRYKPGAGHHGPDCLSRSPKQPAPPSSPNIDDPCLKFNEERVNL